MKYWYIVILSACTNLVAAQDIRVVRFAAGLDSIRTQLKIPGMAVAIKQDKNILLKQGFGFADLKEQVPVSAQTSFRVASVTKTFTSTLIMQLVAKGKLNLDDPISKYGLDLGNPNITVRHLLTHTSEGTPGMAFRYNGYRFGLLGPVMEKAAGMPFYRLLMEQILIPLKMTSSAPFISLHQFYEYRKSHPEMVPYFDTAFNRLAVPYNVTAAGEVVRMEYPGEFGAFGGLVTTAGDLLKYSDAIDSNLFITPALQQQVFTPNRTRNGVLTPYGFGWFVQQYRGMDFYWHYGQTPGESALFLKVPALRLTLAVTCNTDKLSQPFQLGDGDLFMSPVAQLFYHCFILNGEQPPHDLYNKELIDGATMALFNGDSLKARSLYGLYRKNNPVNGPGLPTGKLVAGIGEAGINRELSRPFTLSRPTRLRIYGVGENCSGDGSSWCDYGWITDHSGKTVWQMQGQAATHAGGAAKNQKVDQVITLPAGTYILHYKSDAGHAYNNWDSLPPDLFFWGILVLDATK
ncbi:serine hydrolase domain-containing protein [Chitinophaga filiformis]|uniref:Beta-lactamase family protein n=1 Tax=Chitinophaga filiformis TaxID=104663 RepID=A0ABY4HY72_CHIFI|nr:serine hydrolase domain-containing protein [Chitinophaga filiformis]UPK68340.1 beta-lactamase family protein [Chitinophaga filiformis]